MAKADQKIEETLTYKRSTKGTHVYVNDAENAALPSVYIKRSALPEKQPDEIKFTLTF